MIKLHLTKSKDYGTGTWEFPSQADADAWLLMKGNSFGNPAPVTRVAVIPPEALSNIPATNKVYDNDLQAFKDIPAVDMNGAPLFDCVMPSEFEVVFEDMSLDPAWRLAEIQANRAREYPPAQDYLDAVVKNDQVQIAKYIADCQAVKAKYPKN